MEIVAAVGSVAATVLAGLTLFAMWYWRRADRPKVQVVGITAGIDLVTVMVRNEGGGDATVTGLRLWEIGTSMPTSGRATPRDGTYELPGGDAGEMVYTREELAKKVPPHGRVFAAATQSNGRVSKGVPVPAPIVEWLRAT
jgi:hypothetical protein